MQRLTCVSQLYNDRKLGPINWNWKQRDIPFIGEIAKTGEPVNGRDDGESRRVSLKLALPPIPMLRKRTAQNSFEGGQGWAQARLFQPCAWSFFIQSIQEFLQWKHWGYN